MDKEIKVGDAEIKTTPKGLVVTWGEKSRGIALCGYSDEEHKKTVGESRTIVRSGEAKSENVNLGKIIGEKATPGTYYFVAVAEGFEDLPVSFEWRKPEVIRNTPTVKSPPPQALATPPTSAPAPSVMPKAPTSIQTDTDLVLKAVSERLDVIEATQRVWSEKHTKGTFIPDRGMLDLMDQGLNEIENILSSQSGPKFNEERERIDNCKIQLKIFKEILAISIIEKNRKIPAPKSMPTRAPATITQPDLSVRINGLEGEIQGIKGTLNNHAEDLKKTEEKVGEIETEVKGIRNEVKTGFENLKVGINSLKQATPSQIDNGSSGNNNGGGDTGKGKASAEPWSLGGSWLGVLITLVILFVIGLIALCAFQAGWIHKSPAAIGATYMGGSTQQPLIVTVTNAMSQMTPPVGGQQAVAAPPALTPEQIEAFAAKHLKDQTEHAKAMEAMVANATSPPPARQKAEAEGRSITITMGDDSIIAGRDVTVINNYNPPPTSSGNGGGGSGSVVPTTFDGYGIEVQRRSVRLVTEYSEPEPVDPGTLVRNFNRRIGMMDFSPYGY